MICVEFHTTQHNVAISIDAWWDHVDFISACCCLIESIYMVSYDAFDLLICVALQYLGFLLFVDMGSGYISVL